MHPVKFLSRGRDGGLCWPAGLLSYIWCCAFRAAAKLKIFQTSEKKWEVGPGPFWIEN